MAEQEFTRAGFLHCDAAPSTPNLRQTQDSRRRTEASALTSLPTICTEIMPRGSISGSAPARRCKHTNTRSHRHISAHSLGSLACSLPVVKIISSATTSVSEDVVKCAVVHTSPTLSNQRTLWQGLQNGIMIKVEENLACYGLEGEDTK